MNRNVITEGYGAGVVGTEVPVGDLPCLRAVFATKRARIAAAGGRSFGAAVRARTIVAVADPCIVPQECC